MGQPMRARTSLIFLVGAALGAAVASRRLLSLVGAITERPLWGYGASLRSSQVAPEDLLRRRSTADEQSEAARELLGRLVERIKSRYDQDAASGRKEPPAVDILVISGGGDWGAFGAGFLKGWQKVPSYHPLAKPEFDAVTGVSTGTLIAPFAFLGDEQSIEQIVNMYRNPKKDWVKQRGYLYFLPDNISFAEVPGLEREIRDHITLDMLRRIAKAGADGRLLLVNTTELDVGQPRVFDLVAEAQRVADSGQIERVHNIILASAGIPGAFPFRMIDGALYVDGGVTGNIIYGGRIAEEDSLPALWQKAYPNHGDPKFRFWVIFNNQFRPVPKPVAPNWLAVIQRSLETATRAATATAVRHLFAMAEISRLKRKADVEVRIVSIPGDWLPPVPAIFNKETMNNLADLGEKMGADPASWSSEPRESYTAQHVSLAGTKPS